MAGVKLHKTDELKRMSIKDRTELLTRTLAELAHQKLRVRTAEDKKSDRIGKLKKQVACIKTFNNQAQNEK